MLLRLFRSNQPILFASLPLVVALFWFPGWSEPSGPVQSFNLLHFVFEKFGFYSVHGVVSGAIIVLISTFVFNNLFQQYDLTDRKNQLPGLCFVLAFSWTPFITHYNHVLLAILFLLLVIRRMMFIYRQPNVSRELFDTGLLLGIGSLFFLPLALFFVAIWISILSMRTFNWREFLMPLIGFATVILIFASLDFIFTWNTASSLVEQFRFPLRSVAVTPIFFLRFVLLIVTSLLAIFAGKSFIYALSRGTTRNKNLKVILLLFSINAALLYLGLLIYPDTGSCLYLISLPLALLLVYSVADSKVNWMITSLFYLFVFLILVNNYSLFLWPKSL